MDDARHDFLKDISPSKPPCHMNCHPRHQLWNTRSHVTSANPSKHPISHSTSNLGGISNYLPVDDAIDDGQLTTFIYMKTGEMWHSRYGKGRQEQSVTGLISMGQVQQDTCYSGHHIEVASPDL
eukprot:scaffold88952_cov32-Attheya_sp.AAC.1